MYAACALSRLTKVESWPQMLAPVQKTDPCLRDVFEAFVPAGSAHFSHFLELRDRIMKCPSGHRLLPNTLAYEPICDDCQEAVNGTCTVGCRQCDFDLCMHCLEADRFLGCHLPVPFQTWPVS